MGMVMGTDSGSEKPSIVLTVRQLVVIVFILLFCAIVVPVATSWYLDWRDTRARLETTTDNQKTLNALVRRLNAERNARTTDTDQFLYDQCVENLFIRNALIVQNQKVLKLFTGQPTTPALEAFKTALQDTNAALNPTTSCVPPPSEVKP